MAESTEKIVNNSACNQKHAYMDIMWILHNNPLLFNPKVKNFLQWKKQRLSHGLTGLALKQNCSIKTKAVSKEVPKLEKDVIHLKQKKG